MHLRDQVRLRDVVVGVDSKKGSFTLIFILLAITWSGGETRDPTVRELGVGLGKGRRCVVGETR